MRMIAIAAAALLAACASGGATDVLTARSQAKVPLRQTAKLQHDPRVVLVTVARRMGVRLRPIVPLPAIHLESRTPLGRLQRGVGHHVQEADVQFTDILVDGTVERQHFVAAVAQPAEGGQVGMLDQRHESPYITISSGEISLVPARCPPGRPEVFVSPPILKLLAARDRRASGRSGGTAAGR